MHRYHWSLKKSLEFIKNKKCDVEIRKYFLDQLASFEERLKMNGISKFSNDWNNDGMYIDADEMIIRNTYINGIIKKNEINKIRENNYRPVTPNRNKIRWADGSRLVNVRIIKDVLFQKDFSLIASNKNKMPKKSCMKKRNNTKINTQEIKRSSSVVTTPLRISDSITNHREIENFNKTAFNSLAEAGKIKHISSSEKNLDLNKKESLYLSSKYVDRNMNRIIENDVGRETNLEKKYLVKSSEINEKGSYKNVNSYPDPYTSIKEPKEAINKMESNKIQSNFKDNDLKQRYSSKDNHNYRNIEKLNSNQHISSNPSNAKKNNYIGQNTPIASQYDNISKRANSLDRKSNNPLSVSENKNIIISPKYENIINNNYNNIYIQSKDFEKIRDLNEYSYSLKPIKNKENQNDTSKEIPRKDNGYSLKDLNYNYNLNNNNKYDTNQELNKNYYIRDNIKQVNYSSSDFNFKNARYDIQDNPYRNNRNNLINSTGKLIKNSENQKTISSLCNRYNHVE